MKMLRDCEMVLYCHLGCNGNSSGPLKSTFGVNFIQFQNPVNFVFACSCLQCGPGLHGRQNLSTKFLLSFVCKNILNGTFLAQLDRFVDRGGICGLRVYRKWLTRYEFAENIPLVQNKKVFSFPQSWGMAVENYIGKLYMDPSWGVECTWWTEGGQICDSRGSGGNGSGIP